MSGDILYWDVTSPDEAICKGNVYVYQCCNRLKNMQPSALLLLISSKCFVERGLNYCPQEREHSLNIDIRLKSSSKIEMIVLRIPEIKPLRDCIRNSRATSPGQLLTT